MSPEHCASKYQDKIAKAARLETEKTKAGTQTLIHGVAPLRAIDRFEADRKARNDARKAKAQEPGGLFNDAERSQIDLADLL